MLNLDNRDIASAVEYAASQLAQGHAVSRVRNDLVAQGTSKEIAHDVVRTVLRRHRRAVRRIGLMQLGIGVVLTLAGLIATVVPLLLLDVQGWLFVTVGVMVLGGTYAAVGAFRLITGIGGTSFGVPNLAGPPIRRSDAKRR